ncbi:MAG: Asp23/Gls24 family envelope stress response protein [Planctomycetota bacterium]|jgi:hypothetical protein
MLAKYEAIVAKIAGTLMGIFLIVAPFKSGGDQPCTLMNSTFVQVISFVAGALILFCMVRIWKKTKSGVSAKSITVKTEEGESRIAIGALEGLLRDELCREKDIHDVEVSLAVAKDSGSVSCALHFKLDSQPNIPARVDVHKRTVREAFDNLIPGQQELKINCTVDNIMVSDKSEKTSGSDVPSAGFSGPVYPVPSENGEDSDF